MQRHSVGRALRLRAQDEIGLDKSQACFKKTAVESKKSDEQKTARVQYSCSERWIGMDSGCGWKSKLLRELLRNKKLDDRRSCQRILRDTQRAFYVLLRFTDHRGDGKGTEKLGRRERIKPGHGSYVNIETLR